MSKQPHHGGSRKGAGPHLTRVRSLIRARCYLLAEESVRILEKMTAESVRLNDYAELWFGLHSSRPPSFSGHKRESRAGRVKHNVSLSDAVVARLAAAECGHGRALDVILSDYEGFVAQYGRPVPLQVSIPEFVFKAAFDSDRLKVQCAIFETGKLRPV